MDRVAAYRPIGRNCNFWTKPVRTAAPPGRTQLPHRRRSRRVVPGIIFPPQTPPPPQLSPLLLQSSDHRAQIRRAKQAKVYRGM